MRDDPHPFCVRKIIKKKKIVKINALLSYTYSLSWSLILSLGFEHPERRPRAGHKNLILLLLLFVTGSR